jgi:hypothetical protein
MSLEMEKKILCFFDHEKKRNLLTLLNLCKIDYSNSIEFKQALFNLIKSEILKIDRLPFIINHLPSDLYLILPNFDATNKIASDPLGLEKLENWFS